MPNLPVHIDVALRLVERLGLTLSTQRMGALLLGATAPDMRAITKRSRQEYHFAPLDFRRLGHGFRALLEAHPELSPQAMEDPQKRAFMAGYVSHLVTDELWILEVFRPFFGDGTPFPDRATALVLDRALQLELDRRAQPAVEEGLPTLAALPQAPPVGFIPREELDRWLHWTVQFLGRGFSWERLRFMARRIARGEGDHPAHRAVEEFLRDVEAGLRRVWRAVPEERVDAFLEKALTETALRTEAYLR